jgi:hypothetical protein
MPASADIHGLVSMLSFLSILATMLLFSRTRGPNKRWCRFGFWSWFCALVVTGSFVLAAAIHHPTRFAVFQRLFLGAVMLWITATAVWMNKLVHD